MSAGRAIRMVVVGSLNMDLCVRVPRLPEPGETVAGRSLERSPGGKGANQAVAASRLGASASLVGSVGTDSFGTELTRGLTAEGVDVAAVTYSATAPTGVAMIIVEASGENMITLAPGANGELRPADLAGLGPMLADADALLLQLEIPLATVRAAARTARDHGVPVILNAAPLPLVDAELLDLLHLTDLLVVNETEAAGLTGLDRADPAATAVALRRLGPPEVVLTLGAQGAVAADAAGVHQVPPFAVDAVDAVGAGDAFCAELVLARAGCDTPGALAAATGRACAAGALATTRPGAQTAAPWRAEVDRLLAEQRGVGSHAR
ncbi:ribokinase [Micromonospora sp. CPCC 205556]|uniref:ribokinase n=1 Tax=Micromonospora sp. CPCC 205556 TaxID=3122398 RepID=UPI002FEF2B12